MKILKIIQARQSLFPKISFHLVLIRAKDFCSNRLVIGNLTSQNNLFTPNSFKLLGVQMNFQDALQSIARPHQLMKSYTN